MVHVYLYNAATCLLTKKLMNLFLWLLSYAILLLGSVYHLVEKLLNLNYFLPEICESL